MYRPTPLFYPIDYRRMRPTVVICIKLNRNPSTIRKSIMSIIMLSTTVIVHHACYVYYTGLPGLIDTIKRMI